MESIRDWFVTWLSAPWREMPRWLRCVIDVVTGLWTATLSIVDNHWSDWKVLLYIGAAFAFQVGVRIGWRANHMQPTNTADRP
jgi:hypothetical protein